MNNGEYFKINTVEELKQAYEMFKDKWWENFTLEEEIEYFETTRAKHIVKDKVGDVYLNLKNWIEHYNEIPSPLKKKRPRQIVRIEDLTITPLEDEFILVEPKLVKAKDKNLFIKNHNFIREKYYQKDFWYNDFGQKCYQFLIKEPEESSLQKTLEIGDLNISILNYLTANGIVDSSLTGQEAQEIVDKIDELSRIILK